MFVHPQEYSPFPMIRLALDCVTFPSKIRGVIGLYFSEDRVLRPIELHAKKFAVCQQSKTSLGETVLELGGRRLRRERLGYDTNTTISRSLELPQKSQVSEGPFNDKDAVFLEISEIRDAIGDHAYRRVMLFYYLALVYYKTGCKISLAKTLLQHGKSSYDWSSAAHSSILPNVTDDFFERLKKKLSEEGVSEKTRSILLALGVSSEKLKEADYLELDEDAVEWLLEDIDTRQGLLNDQCAFYHNLNSTVELPHSVNEFDTVIEDVMRTKALKLLSLVSNEGLHPYKALIAFVDEMQKFFSRSEKVTSEKISLLKVTQSLEENLWFLEKNYSSIQLKDFLATTQKIGQCYRRINDLRSHSLSTNLKGRLTWQKNYFSPQTKVSQKNRKRIARFIANSPEWFPKPIQYLKNPLETALKIVELQKRTTILPPLELLSGKLIDNTLVPLSEEELFEQSLQLIRRS